MEIFWNCTDIVTKIDEESVTTLLYSMNVDELLERYREKDLPSHSGLSFVQCFRHIIREKMGNDRFYSLEGMGSIDGQKKVATLFEKSLEKYLNEKNLTYKTEADVLVDRENSRGFTVGKFKPTNQRHQKTGNILYVGPCGCCGMEARVPFKPIHKPALCADCNRLPPTPDFLLLDDNVTINGHVVRWIDCK